MTELTFKKFNDTEEERDELWNNILMSDDQYFYGDEIYYDWYGEPLPKYPVKEWREDWDARSPERKREYLHNRFGYYWEDRPKGTAYSVYMGDELVGWFQYYLKEEKRRTPTGRLANKPPIPIMELKYIVVKDDKQGKGIGKRIMEFVFEEAKKIGRYKILLAYNGSEALRKFYFGLGFKEQENFGLLGGSYTTLEKELDEPKKKRGRKVIAIPE